MNKDGAARPLPSEARKILVFLLVGVFTTACNYSVFWLLLNVFHLHYLVSSWTGYLTGVLAGFFLNARFTFAAGKTGGRDPALYLAVYLFSLAVSTGLLYLLVDLLGIAPEWANIIAIGQSTVTNYVGCRFFVFRS